MNLIDKLGMVRKVEDVYTTLKNELEEGDIMCVDYISGNTDSHIFHSMRDLFFIEDPKYLSKKFEIGIMEMRNPVIDEIKTQVLQIHIETGTCNFVEPNLDNLRRGQKFRHCFGSKYRSYPKYEWKPHYKRMPPTVRTGRFSFNQITLNREVIESFLEKVGLSIDKISA